MKTTLAILLAVCCLSAVASIKLPRAFIFVTQAAVAFQVQNPNETVRAAA